MTDTEKEKIAQLRKQGRSYSCIAEELGLKETTVKNHCVRNKIKMEVCPQCGDFVPQSPNRKYKRFCSAICRIKWWNSHPDAGRRNPHHTQVCPSCQKEFNCYRARHRVYCSRKCYLNAIRKAVPGIE